MSKFNRGRFGGRNSGKFGKRNRESGGFKGRESGGFGTEDSRSPGRRESGGFRKRESSDFPKRESGGFGGKGRSRFDRRESGGFSRDSERPTMHKAVCDKCGERCEVPFMPNPGKPVYCRNCYHKDERPSGSNKSSSMSHELAKINEKLDKIIRALNLD